MKQLTTIFTLLFILFSSLAASAQIQVRIGVPRPQPRVVVVERPSCPGHDYVWVEGHYVYDSYTRRDVWIAGQWAYIEPPRYEKGRGHKYGHRKHGNRDRDRDYEGERN